MQETPYLIGIDLGTTNSSVAYIYRTNKRSQNTIKIFEIPQRTTLQKNESRSSLPSFHYTFSQHENAGTQMPWQGESNYTIGEFAKAQSLKVPGNGIHSAKSWLCHGRIDRQSNILPWASKSDIEKISPVVVSARYLEYMKEAWNCYQAKNEDEHFEKQKIVLTVPASFDETARNLTLEAAKIAGLSDVTLLEEPMAAFYSWIYFYQAKWPKKIKSKMLTLVCDVGGGTTDFSLIEVENEENNMSFKRVAVGNHLLLGGDNMDLALAFHVESKFVKNKLSSEQFMELVAGCRYAKELLWSSGNESEGIDIAIMGQGSSIIKGSQKFHITREMLEEVIVSGFFSPTQWQEQKKVAQKGFKEWGLPYENDPNIMRHLRDFLQTHLPPDTKPDLVLFNGGVLTPKVIRQKIVTQINEWFQQDSKWKAHLLTNTKLDLAVAIGACYFHLVKSGEGIHIEGGVPRTYYLEIKHGGQIKCICILPFGSRQQQFFEIDQHAMEVIAKRPVAFTLYYSNKRKADELADIIDIQDNQMTCLPPLTTVIQVGKTAKKQQIPVKMQVQVNEIGLLDVRLIAKDSDRSWRLQFQINAAMISKEENKNKAKNKIIKKDIPFPQEKIKQILEQTFCGDNSPRTLKSDLEKVIGHNRSAWTLEINRKLCDLLVSFSRYKNKSEAHEERWLHFMGFCLRPGIGFPGDEWRVKKLFPISEEKVHFEKNIQNWLEYWILWRRVAAGLKSDQELNIFKQMGEHILGRNTKWKSKKQVRKHVKPAELTEMWRTAASMENLPLKLKKELGDTLQNNIKSSPNEQLYWALGRIGARVPIYGQNILPKEQISSWIQTLLALSDDNFHRFSSIAQLSRKTGDRALDIEESLQKKVLQKLESNAESSKLEHLYTMVKEITILDENMQGHYLGDSLPAGLVLKKI